MIVNSQSSTNLRSCTTLAGDVLVQIYPESCKLDTALEVEVKRLFNDIYYRYHYQDKLASAESIRLLAYRSNRICGFGTVKIHDRFAILSSIAVDTSFQRKRIGTFIEECRHQCYTELDKVPYVSCVTEGLASQRLKVKYGMLPINIKYGYRQNVFRKNDISSAVTYADDANSALCIPCSDITINHEQKRIRVLSQSIEYLRNSMQELSNYPDYYADCLFEYRPDEDELSELGFEFQGEDYNWEPYAKGYLYQLKNKTRMMGIEHGALDLNEESRVYVQKLATLGVASRA